MKKKATSSSATSLWRPIGLLVVVILVLILAKVFHLGDRISALQDWIKSLGAWGPAVFTLIYIVAVVAAFPASAMTLLAGALFGPVLGIIVTSVGATVGASLAFLIGRYFARKAVQQWIYKNKKFQELDEMTEKRGAIIVAITRLIPLFPFNVLNYGFGLTRIKFWEYVFWSWLCTLPGTIVFVVGAAAFTKGLSEGKVPWPLLGVLAVGILVLTLVVKIAKKKLDTVKRKGHV
ncbi:MAG TPA: TVP38/TMEM64 family protein [bacterium]